MHPSLRIKFWGDIFILFILFRGLDLQSKSPQVLVNRVDASNLIDDVIPIIELYYLARFDPAGIKEAEKAQLNSLIRLWLEKYERVSK